MRCSDLAACVQKEGEILAPYMRCFIHLKCQVSDIQEVMVIESIASGLKTGLAQRQIRVEEPRTLEYLLQILEAQVRGEEDELKAKGSRGNVVAPEQFQDRRRGRPEEYWSG